MARLFYACRFDVEGEDCIASVLSIYKDWIVRHYRDRCGLPEFNFDPEVTGASEGLPTNHSLSSSIFCDGGERVVRIRWSIPDDTDVGLRWANEVRVGQFDGRCGIEHLISIESVEYSVAPARLSFGSPRVVRDICTMAPAYIEKMQIKAEPYDLAQDGIDDLLALLTSDLRRLPVILLSPYAKGELNEIDPDRLARNLAGVAVVVSIKDPELTWDFADEIGRQLSCFNGAARIYWPGFSTASGPQDHRLYFGDWIQRVGPVVAARAIERAIFAVAAFRYVPDNRIKDLIRRTEVAERQKLLAKKKETGDDFWADYECDLARLDEAKAELEELKAENANLKANQQVFLATGTGEPDEPEQPEVPSFSSVADAVRAAKQYQNLEILDTATSAAKASQFQRPYDIFNALTDLDKFVGAWSKNRDDKGSGVNLLQYLRDRGWGKRSSMRISDTARGKYRAQYEFKYMGEKKLFEPHITIGSGDPNSCASIHFIFDQDRMKIVVAYVGKHLRNTKT